MSGIEEVVVRLLREALKDDEEALAIAEKIYQAYKERGRRGVREYIARLLEEGDQSAANSEEG